MLDLTTSLRGDFVTPLTRDKHTDSQQQRNNTWLPPPRRIHKEQEECPKLHKKICGEILSPI